MGAMDAALARIEAGESDGKRRGIPYVRCEGGYLFKLAADAAPRALNVMTTSGYGVRDLNDGTGKPELDGRPGRLEAWEQGGAVLLSWDRFPEVA